MNHNESLHNTGGPVFRSGRSVLHAGVACLVILASALMGGCSTTAELSSAWNNNEIIIDGLATDWRSYFYYLKDSQVSLGIRNDSDFLYVCLMAPEGQFRRQMVGPGLTVWLESEDGKKLGIHYPIGLPGRETPAPFNRTDARSREEMEDVVEQSLEKVELLGPVKGDRRHPPYRPSSTPCERPVRLPRL